MNVNILKVSEGHYEWLIQWGAFGFKNLAEKPAESKHEAWCAIRAHYRYFGLDGTMPIGEVLGEWA